MNRIDKETSQIISDEKKVYDLLQHEGWGVVHNKFKEKIEDLQSVLNVSGVTNEQIATDIKSRVIAISILVDWMNEVIGMKQSSENTRIEVKRESLIVRQ